MTRDDARLLIDGCADCPMVTALPGRASCNHPDGAHTDVTIYALHGTLAKSPWWCPLRASTLLIALRQ